MTRDQGAPAGRGMANCCERSEPLDARFGVPSPRGLLGLPRWHQDPLPPQCASAAAGSFPRRGPAGSHPARIGCLLVRRFVRNDDRQARGAVGQTTGFRPKAPPSPEWRRRFQPVNSTETRQCGEPAAPSSVNLTVNTGPSAAPAPFSIGSAPTESVPLGASLGRVAASSRARIYFGWFDRYPRRVGKSRARFSRSAPAE